MSPPRRRPALPLPATPFISGQTQRPPPAFEELLGGLADEDQFWFGVDLFNAGAFFEAHEAWELCWRTAGAKAGRDSDDARYLQALIKLAAAGAKLRQASAVGRVSHAEGALALTATLPGTPRAGVSIAAIEAAAAQLARGEEPVLL
jgi:hypothetical protein